MGAVLDVLNSITGTQGVANLLYVGFRDGFNAAANVETFVVGHRSKKILKNTESLDDIKGAVLRTEKSVAATKIAIDKSMKELLADDGDGEGESATASATATVVVDGETKTATASTNGTPAGTASDGTVVEQVDDGEGGSDTMPDAPEPPANNKKSSNKKS